MKALTSHQGRSSEVRSSLVLAMLTAASIAAVHGALAEGTTAMPPSSKAVAVVSALPPPCPTTAPCKLSIGKAYGDPWVRAEAGDANYFKVKILARQTFTAAGAADSEKRLQQGRQRYELICTNIKYNDRFISILMT